MCPGSFITDNVGPESTSRYPYKVEVCCNLLQGSGSICQHATAFGGVPYVAAVLHVYNNETLHGGDKNR